MNLSPETVSYHLLPAVYSNALFVPQGCLLSATRGRHRHKPRLSKQGSRGLSWITLSVYPIKDTLV